MKPTSISAEALFEEHRAALHWEWVAGHAHPERRFDEAAVRDARSAADLRTAPQTCIGCHQQDDTHKGQFGAECGACHKTDAAAMAAKAPTKCKECHGGGDE